MELELNYGIEELMAEEMNLVDGGATVGEAVAATIGIAAICWAAPVGIVVGSTALGVGMVVAGAGTVVNLVTSKKK